MSVWSDFLSGIARGMAALGAKPVVPQPVAEPAPDRFTACLPFTLKEEGGFSTDRDDPGNWTGGAVDKGSLNGTKFGISAAAYPTLNILALTEADAAAIYQRDYWTPARCMDLPAGVDQCHFDAAVNCGVRRAVLVLQNATAVEADGIMGPATLAAAPKMEPATLITILTAAREHFYATMANAPKYAKALDGRAERCRAAAMAMLPSGVA